MAPTFHDPVRSCRCGVCRQYSPIDDIEQIEDLTTLSNCLPILKGLRSFSLDGKKVPGVYLFFKFWDDPDLYVIGKMSTASIATDAPNVEQVIYAFDGVLAPYAGGSYLSSASKNYVGKVKMNAPVRVNRSITISSVVQSILQFRSLMQNPQASANSNTDIDAIIPALIDSGLLQYTWALDNNALISAASVPPTFASKAANRTVLGYLNINGFGDMYISQRPAQIIAKTLSNAFTEKSIPGMHNWQYKTIGGWIISRYCPTCNTTCRCLGFLRRNERDVRKLYPTVEEFKYNVYVQLNIVSYPEP